MIDSMANGTVIFTSHTHGRYGIAIEYHSTSYNFKDVCRRDLGRLNSKLISLRSGSRYIVGDITSVLWLPIIRTLTLTAFRSLQDSLLVVQRFEAMADVSVDVHVGGSEIGVDPCVVCKTQHRNCSCWVFLYLITEVVRAWRRYILK